MSINLLELAKDHLGEAVISKIASTIGIDPSLAQGAIGKVFPSLLGLFADKASTESGASQIFDLVKGADSGPLDSLVDSLSGDQSENIKKSGGILSGLFGDKLGAFSQILDQIPGLGNGKAGSLLGLLTPVLTGMLGKQVASSGLNASGLTSLLSSQKDHIKGALDDDFIGSLGIASLGGGSTQAPVQAQDIKPASPSQTTASSSVAPETNHSHQKESCSSGAGGSPLWKLLPLLLLGLLAFFLMKMCGGSEASKALKEGASSAADAAGNAVSKTVDGAGNALDSAGEAIGSAANSTGEALGNAAGSVKEATGNALGNAAGAMKDAAGNAVDATGNAVGNAAGAMKDAAGNAVDATGNALGNATQGAGEALNKAFSFVPKGIEGETPAALSEGVKMFAQKLQTLNATDETALNKFYSDLATDGKAQFLYRIPFATGQTGVPDSHQSALIEKLKTASSDGTLITIGYADTRGDDALNHRLSYGRAKEVGAWIKSTVGSDSALETFSMGETDRFSKTDFAKNRVVEVWQILP